MITFVIVFCVCLAIYSAMGLGAWGALFASFGTMMVLGFLINMVLFKLFKD